MPRWAILLALLAGCAWGQRPAKPPASAAPNGAGLPARAAMLAAAGLGTGVLFLTPQQVAFAAGNPSLQPVVAGSTPVRAYVILLAPKGRRARWSLRLRAQGARLRSGASTIPVRAITWKTTGAVLVGNGTVAGRGGNTPLTTVGVVAARGAEGTLAPFAALVTCNFEFHDSWNYAPGSYAQTVLFTLAAP